MEPTGVPGDGPSTRSGQVMVTTRCPRTLFLAQILILAQILFLALVSMRSRTLRSRTCCSWQDFLAIKFRHSCLATTVVPESLQRPMCFWSFASPGDDYHYLVPRHGHPCQWQGLDENSAGSKRLRPHDLLPPTHLHHYQQLKRAFDFEQNVYLKEHCVCAGFL